MNLEICFWWGERENQSFSWHAEYGRDALRWVAFDGGHEQMCSRIGARRQVPIQRYTVRLYKQQGSVWRMSITTTAALIVRSQQERRAKVWNQLIIAILLFVFFLFYSCRINLQYQNYRLQSSLRQRKTNSLSCYYLRSSWFFPFFFLLFYLVSWSQFFSFDLSCGFDTSPFHQPVRCCTVCF